GVMPRAAVGPAAICWDSGWAGTSSRCCLVMYHLLRRLSWRHKLCAVATIGTLWTIDCGSPGSPSGKVLSFDNGDNGRVLVVGLDDEIDVRLQTIGPGQYDEHPGVSSPAVAFSKVSILMPANP